MFHELFPGLSCLVPADIDGQPSFLQAALAAGYPEVYVVSPEGIFKHAQLISCDPTVTRFVRTKVDKIPTRAGMKSLVPVTEVINFLPAGKIPYELLEQVKLFFRLVIARHNKDLEAMIWIVWSKDKGYHLIVPKQRVGGASAWYDWGSLPMDTTLVVDIHSHANFSAFFSGTDDNDDRNSIRISGVLGYNNTPEEKSIAAGQKRQVWRFNCGHKKFDCTVDDIFYHPPIKTSIPESWMDEVNASAPSAVVYSRYVPAGQQPWNPPGKGIVSTSTKEASAPSATKYASGFSAGSRRADKKENRLPEYKKGGKNRSRGTHTQNPFPFDSPHYLDGIVEREDSEFDYDDPTLFSPEARQSDSVVSASTAVFAHMEETEQVCVVNAFLDARIAGGHPVIAGSDAWNTLWEEGPPQVWIDNNVLIIPYEDLSGKGQINQELSDEQLRTMLASLNMSGIGVTEPDTFDWAAAQYGVAVAKAYALTLGVAPLVVKRVESSPLLEAFDRIFLEFAEQVSNEEKQTRRATVLTQIAKMLPQALREGKEMQESIFPPSQV